MCLDILPRNGVIEELKQLESVPPFLKLFDKSYLLENNPVEIENHSGFDKGNNPNFPFSVNAYNYKHKDGRHLRVVFSESTCPIDPRAPEKGTHMLITRHMRFHNKKSSLEPGETSFDLLVEFEQVEGNWNVRQASWVGAILSDNQFDFIKVPDASDIAADDHTFYQAVNQTMEIALDFIGRLNAVQAQARKKSWRGLLGK